MLSRSGSAAYFNAQLILYAEVWMRVAAIFTQKKKEKEKKINQQTTAHAQ